MAHVAVIGGGISGLSAALALRDRGVTVTLIEKANRLGGPLFTENVEGMTIDAGPDSFLSSKPGGIELVERLGLSSEMINTKPDGGGTYILHAGELQPLPEGITLLVPTQFKAVATSPLMSPLGKLRLLADYFIPARREDRDESVADFVTRRAGREVFENLAEPLLSGIYAGNARELSLLSTFPRLREAEKQYGGVIRGALARRKESDTRKSTGEPAHTPFVSLAGGMGELIAGLVVTMIRVDFRLATAVDAIEPQPSSYRLALSDGSNLDADGVVLATPAYTSAELLRPISPELGATLNEIPYASSATVSMAFQEQDIADRQVGRGFVIPRVEGRSMTAVTWSSNKFAGRVPEGIALLRCFAGRSGQEEPVALPDDQLIELIRSELAAITGITADPLMARPYRWPKAMPQYTVGHQDRLARINREMARMPAVALTGNAYRGVGIPDCITNSMAEANALVDRLNKFAER